MLVTGLQLQCADWKLEFISLVTPSHRPDGNSVKLLLKTNRLPLSTASKCRQWHEAKGAVNRYQFII